MPSLAKVRAERARRNRESGQDPDYFEWYRRTIPEHFEIPPHIEWICKNIVQPMVAGRLKRVILTIPPQHAKSDTITCRLPVFIGEHFPGDNVLITGYAQDFAESELSQPARDLASVRGVLSHVKKALRKWRFTTGGSVTTRGVGNPPTGVRRLNWILIDDPIGSRAQAESKVFRKALWQWFTGSIVQRFWPDTRVIIIVTRWHEDDLVGRLLKAQPETWTLFNLPAIALEGDLLGRQPGEALWPAQKPIDFLLAQKVASGEVEFEALFQGNPTPREGILFKVDRIIMVDVVPAGLPNCLAWDLAATEDAGDYTAGVQIWGPDQDGIFYEDVIRFQHEPAQRNRRIRAEADRRKPGMVRGPQDPASAGKEAAQAFIRLHAGHNVVTQPVGGEKITRATPHAAQVNAGNVRLLNGPYAADYIEEMRKFPGGANDDMVDASSDALAELCQPDSTFNKAIGALKALAEMNKPKTS